MINQRRKHDIYLKKKKLCKKYPHKYNMSMCLAKKRQEGGKSRRCRLRAIKGTGRCKLHGGMSTGPIKHGRYSAFFKDDILKRYEIFRRDPKILDSKDEIAFLRVLLVECRELLNTAEDGRAGFFLRDQLIKIIDVLGKNIERSQKIKGSAISIEILPILIKQMVEILGESINRCPHCHKDISKLQDPVFDRMASLRLPADDWPGNTKSPPRVVDAEFEKVS